MYAISIERKKENIVRYVTDSKTGKVLTFSSKKEAEDISLFVLPFKHPEDIEVKVVEFNL